MEDDFDPSVYTRAPKLDVAGAVALSIQLLAAVPPEPTPAVKKAAKALRKKAIALQNAWKARDRMEKRADPRPVDVMADGAMGRLYGRIEDYAGLPADQYPLAARAQEILATLFPEGLAFLKSEYVVQWAETQKRLERIEEENLATDIDKVAGPEFLADVRRVHKVYGEAVGVTKARGTVDVPSLASPLREVSAAIAVHAVQLVAIVMDADADAPARRAARAALRPLDAYRAAAARREARRGGEDDVSPETQMPEVPA
jgi:hypothetical protein